MRLFFESTKALARADREQFLRTIPDTSNTYQVVETAAALLQDSEIRESAATALANFTRVAIGFTNVAGTALVEECSTRAVCFRPELARQIFRPTSASAESLVPLIELALSRNDDLARKAVGTVTGAAPTLNEALKVLSKAMAASDPNVSQAAFMELLAITRSFSDSARLLEKYRKAPEPTRFGEQIGRALTTLAASLTKEVTQQVASAGAPTNLRQHFALLRSLGPAVAPELVSIVKLTMLKAGSPFHRGLAADEAAEITINVGASESLPSTDALQGVLADLNAAIADEKVGGVKAAQQRVRDAIEQIVSERRNWAKMASRWYLGTPSAVQVLLGGLGAYSGWLLLAFLVWVVRPASLARRAMRDPTRAEPPMAEGLTQFLLLLRFFGSTDRATRAWLAENEHALARRCFDEQGAVVHRKRFVEVANEDAIKAWQEAWDNDKQVAFWIEGDGGGVGKSALAFHLTTLARVLSPGILPVLVDTDWGEDFEGWLCRTLATDGRELTPQMVRSLARQRRLLLVFDGLSEFATKTPPEWASRIVTSRKKPKTGQYQQFAVRLLESSEQVKTLVEKYCFDGGPAAPETTEPILREVEDFREGHEIRPLFVRLIVEQRLKAKAETPAGPTSGTASSPHTLIHSYVQMLRPQGPRDLDERSFWRAAKCAAFYSVEKDWEPRVRAQDTLESHLRVESTESAFVANDSEEVPAERVLEALGTCGLLRFMPGLIPTVTFLEDTVAEYLAAAYLVGRYETDRTARFAGFMTRALKSESFAKVLGNLRPVSSSPPSKLSPDSGESVAP